MRKTSVVDTVFNSLECGIDVSSRMEPHVYIAFAWKKYQKTGARTNNLNGAIFERILSCCLKSNGIGVVYEQARLLHIPGVSFDFVAFEEGLRPVVISAKTSLRERWKQAELEGRLLKQVYHRASCYLVTLNKKERENISRKITEQQAIGIDGVVAADRAEFTDLIRKLGQLKYESAIDYRTVNP